MHDRRLRGQAPAIAAYDFFTTTLTGVTYHILAVVEHATGFYPGWDEHRLRGVAVSVPALLDGRFLKRIVDEDLDVRAAVRGLAHLAG